MRYIYKEPKTAPFEVKMPKNFEKYIHEQIFHPIIYDRHKRKAHCFHCGNTFDFLFADDKREPKSREVHIVEKFLAKDYISCPICKKKAVAYPFKNHIGTGRYSCIGWNDGDDLKLAILDSYYHVQIEDIEAAKEIQARTCVAEIITLSRKEQEAYISWGDGWVKTDSMYIHESFRNVSLHQSMMDAIDKSFLKHINIVHYDELNAKVKCLALNAKRTQMEYLVKLGLPELEYAMVYGWPTRIYPNWNKRTLSGVLGVSDQDIDKLKQWGRFNIEDIALYKLIKKAHEKITKKDLETTSLFFDGARKCRGELKSIDLVRVSRYLEKYYQDNRPSCSQGLWGYSRERVLGEYIDYLTQMRTLKYPEDDYYLFPKDLTEAHDRVSAEFRKMKNKEEAKRIAKQQEQLKKREKKLKKLEFEDDVYLIRPLLTKVEFDEEGKNNRNCVASYFIRASEGKTNIFVIRRKEEPDTSLATVELSNDGHMVQCRGKGNINPPPEVMEFAQKWLKEIVRKKKKVAVVSAA